MHKLFQYVKNQAVYIIIYFEITNLNDVNDGVFTRLQKTTKWYKLGTEELFMFMESTIEGFKIPDEIKSIIEEIEKISVDTIGQFRDCMNNIKEEYKKKSRFNDILSNMNSDYVIKLNYGFLKNCVDAIHFINKYTIFLNNTNGLPEKLKYFGINDINELCNNDNLDNVFNAN
jgi:inorganic pyrophosphatase